MVLHIFHYSICIIMKITLDNRERDLYEKIIPMNQSGDDGTTIMSSQLTIGDILIQTDDSNDVILIERKSLKDLLASIKDGRYEEQSHRLIHSSGFPIHNILYIIEGPMNSLKSLAERKLVYSCITSLNYFKGFSVLRTASVLETAELVLQMANKISRNFIKGVPPCYPHIMKTQNEVEVREPPCDYSQVVKKVKKDNITRENIGRIVLCQIPGISSKSAAAIMSKFGTFSNLLSRLESDPDCMNDITYEASDGKHRKISKICAQNIHNLFIENHE